MSDTNNVFRAIIMPDDPRDMTAVTSFRKNDSKAKRGAGFVGTMDAD
jgi:hypothetical protein